MDAARVKFNLGRTVVYRGAQYKLTACITRQGDGGFHLQAELTDLKAKSALVIADLKDVEERTDNYESENAVFQNGKGKENDPR